MVQLYLEIARQVDKRKQRTKRKMVKADYKRDYYADLEISNTADTETIKKKFRELGTCDIGKSHGSVL